MKMTVIRVERVERSGTSKAGNPYNIDQTNIVVQVPYAEANGYGFKEQSFKYGKASQFAKLDTLRDRLPIELELDLGIEINDYGQPVTVIKDLKLPTIKS